jgi:hypothetical protein
MEEGRRKSGLQATSCRSQATRWMIEDRRWKIGAAIALAKAPEDR